MQKSGIKFLRVLPKTIIGLSLALGMTTSAHAAEWALGTFDYYSGSPGQACYSDYSDYVVHECKCSSNAVSSYSYCPGNDGALECWLEGYPPEGYTRFCWPRDLPNICDACGCNNSTTSWTSIGSGRVTRTVTTVSSGSYTCTSSTTTEYGCEAGYFKKSGSGSSLTCEECPPDGTSNLNATQKTECYMPAGSTFTDDKGTYTCGGKAYWQN